jgi:Asp-tRNA(Asn)/Glu-tRNA(Gln) amidotransferase A subunit family amidase
MTDTKDMPTEHGSAIYKDSQPGVDASIVGLLRAAGAIIIGKTVRPLLHSSELHTGKGDDC